MEACKGGFAAGIAGCCVMWLIALRMGLSLTFLFWRAGEPRGILRMFEVEADRIQLALGLERLRDAEGVLGLLFGVLPRDCADS